MSVNASAPDTDIRPELEASRRRLLKFFVRLFVYRAGKYISGVFSLQQLVELGGFSRALLLRKKEWNFADLRFFAKSVARFLGAQDAPFLAQVFQTIRSVHQEPKTPLCLSAAFGPAPLPDDFPQIS